MSPEAGDTPQASTATNGLNRSTDASGLPVFAQTVRDAMNAQTPTPAEAPHGSAKMGGSSKASRSADDTSARGPKKAHSSSADGASAAIPVSAFLLPTPLIPLQPIVVDPLPTLAPNAFDAGSTNAEAFTASSDSPGNSVASDAASAGGNSDSSGSIGLNFVDPAAQQFAASVAQLLAQSPAAPATNGPLSSSAAPPLSSALVADPANTAAACRRAWTRPRKSGLAVTDNYRTGNQRANIFVHPSTR